MKRFTVDNDGKYFDKINKRYVTLDYLIDELNTLYEENQRLKKELKCITQSLQTQLNADHFMRTV